MAVRAEGLKNDSVLTLRSDGSFASLPSQSWGLGGGRRRAWEKKQSMHAELFNSSVLL